MILLKFNRLAILAISLTILLFGCSKNIDTTEPIPFPPGDGFGIPAPSPLRGDVSGQVLNENNIPVAGAEVLLGGSVYQTNAEGFFAMTNVNLDKYVSTITVNKAGYFKALRSFSATTGRNYLNIKLIPKTVSGTIDASSGGNVALSNGTQISFQGNGMIVKATGAAYTGTVRVSSAYIDPTRDDIASIVPGSFMAQDATNMYVLQSAGMIAVDLESASGEPLQLASGKPATMRLPIPASLQASAPSQIDTWSLDDRGIWKKEGTATKVGNNYELQASHFSFWNVDVPCNAIYLTLNVTNQNAQPLINTLVRLRIPNNNTWWSTTTGLTNSQGVVSGLVPASIGLELSIHNGPFQCGNAFFTQNIGPFSNDTTLNITATVPASQALNITGTANACNNQPLNNGMAVIQAPPYGLQYVPIVNGSYTSVLTVCQNISNINVTVMDSTGQTLASSGTIAVSGNSVTVPLITLCGTSQQAVFTIGGCQAGGSYSVNTALDSTNQIFVNVSVTSPGTYTLSTTAVNGMTFSASGNFVSPGSYTVLLEGQGTPTTTGTFNVVVNGGSGTGCTSVINVNNGSPTGQAIYTLACNPQVTGTYFIGLPLTPNNSGIIFTANVTTPGNYSITTTNPVNGMQFSNAGVFQTAGVQTVVLVGSGVPINAGAYVFTLQNSGAACSFTVLVNSSGNAAFTFVGAPANCQQPLIMGSYSASIPMDSTTNYVRLMVDVATTGSYSAATTTINGIQFVGGGNFSTTGVQMMTLNAIGTPIQAGQYNYTPSSNQAIGQGCVFLINTN